MAWHRYRLERLLILSQDGTSYHAVPPEWSDRSDVIGPLAAIPQAKTYEVLESLTAGGFALATPSSPKVYSPVRPSRILNSCYGSSKKKIQDRSSRFRRGGPEARGGRFTTRPSL